MKLPKRIWILWSARLLIADCLIFAILLRTTHFLLSFMLLNFGAATFLLIRFTSFRIKCHKHFLCLHSGVIFSHSTHIRLKGICSEKTICTPLCKALKLSQLILCCEGVVFILPPLPKTLSDTIIKQTKAV